MQEKSGFVPNVFLALAHRPDEFRAFFAYHDALMDRPGNLTKAEREMIVVATSNVNQCEYCVVAHGAILRIRAKDPLIADQVAVNYRKANITPRQRAMLDFAMKVSSRAYEVNESDYETLRSHGLTARYNQQKTMPHSWDEAIRPTLTFSGKTTLTVGGESFTLTHARGETEDQLWVSVPSRRIVVSADYYQGFMPNAGNGRRRQRYVEDWAQALRQMAALNPQRVLTMHGPALVGEPQVQDKLVAHAMLLESIAEQTVRGLNAGLRPDQAVERVEVTPELARRDDLKPDYVSGRDIARMVAKQYGGWWDDVPSHWNPAPLAAQARAIAALAGGARPLIERAKAISRDDPAVAASLADWAWLAAPDDALVLQGALDVYGARIRDDTTTQEALVYLEHMIRLKLRLGELMVPRGTQARP